MPKCECSAGKVGASVRSTSWSVQGAEAKSCAVRAVGAVVSGPWGDRDALHSKIRISLQKLSAISTCIEKKKSLDATRLLQARSRIPSSRPHGTIGPSASHVPKLDSIPRLHAPKLLTDLHHLHSSAHRFDPFKWHLQSSGAHVATSAATSKS